MTNDKADETRIDETKGTLEVDPPIIVGGGGSTYIWVLKDKPLTLVPDPHPVYTIRNQHLYYCFDVQVDIDSVEIDDGVTPWPLRPVRHPRRHRTNFNLPG